MSEKEKDVARRSSEQGPLAENVRQNFCKYVSLLILMGLVNNVGYVMVGTTAKELSEHFNKKSWLGAFQFCLIVFNSMFRLVNSRYFIKIVHVKRIVVNACAMLGGYILIAVACLLPQDYIVGFFISLVAAVVHGLTACFGESTILGYLKGFPAELIVGWSSGTGFAGVVGAGLVVLLLYFQFELFTIYLVALTLVAGYFFGFIYLNRQKAKFTSQEDPLIATNKVGGEVVVDEAHSNVRMGFGAFLRVFRKIWWLGLSLSLVYYFEYTIFTSFTDRTIRRLHYDKRPDFLHKHLFEILLLAYQCGVVCSRSSLKLFKVKHVWIFFVMQGVVYAFWLTEVIRLYNYGKVMLSDPYGMIAVLFIVGLFGGACYVNVMYSIISHQVLEFDEKELALNICTILDDVGIIGASVTALVLSNFVFIAPA